MGGTLVKGAGSFAILNKAPPPPSPNMQPFATV